MKVVWISQTGDLGGGAEIAMFAGVEGLRERGIEVTIVVPDVGEMASEARRIGAAVLVIPYTVWATIGERALSHRLKRAARNLIYSLPMARALRKLRPDVVVTNTLTIPSGALAAGLARAPHVWFMHEMYGDDGHGWRFDLGERSCFRFIARSSRLVLTATETALESWAKHLPRHKLRRVHYPIDVPARAFPSASDRPFRLLQVGRISRGKHPEDAVRAVGILAAKGLDVHLALAGGEEPGHGAFVRKLIGDLELESRVRVIPFTHDPFAEIAAADVAVTCSLGEACGIAVIEAMKLGKAVVGAASGATVELIGDDRGLLFAPADAADLAAKIESLIRDRDRLRRLGDNAQRWATAIFTRERYVGELLAVFEEAMR